MREILFRGKDTETGEWRYSMTISRHFYNDIEIFSYYIGAGNATIDAKTLGQYTGLTDRNGNKIFEGDIVEYDEIDKRRKKVVFAEGAFALLERGKYATSFADIHYGTPPECCEVIGNIHDNPELIKDGTK